ncbi:MAG: hypothetical protein EB015_15835 [Methylocystaceae bacterium]|nr:hypothetical protein [Methylocystaceae bacterium]
MSHQRKGGAHNAPLIIESVYNRKETNMRTTFDFISDPGHAWLKVNTRDLFALGLTPGDFSSYSYRRGDDLYLEEDCDASLFIQTYIHKTNSKPKFRERVSKRKYSRVRNYECNNRY